MLDDADQIERQGLCIIKLYKKIRINENWMEGQCAKEK